MKLPVLAISSLDDAKDSFKILYKFISAHYLQSIFVVHVVFCTLLILHVAPKQREKSGEETRCLWLGWVIRVRD